MKKAVSAVLSLVLCVCLLGTLGAPRAAAADADVVGAWRVTVDGMEEILGEMGEEDGEGPQLTDYIDSAEVDLYIEFAADGTYTVYMDMLSIAEDMTAAAGAYFTDVLTYYLGEDVTEADFEDVLGMSLDEYCRTNVGDAIRESSADFYDDGTYTVSGDEVILDEGEEDELRLTIRDGCLVGDMEDFGELVLERVDLSSVYLNESGVLTVDPALFGLTLEELGEKTDIHLGRQEEEYGFPDDMPGYYGYLGGNTCLLYFQKDALVMVLHSQDGELAEEAADWADKNLEVLDDEYFWQLPGEDVYLEMWEDTLDDTLMFFQVCYSDALDF